MLDQDEMVDSAHPRNLARIDIIFSSFALFVVRSMVIEFRFWISGGTYAL